MSIQRLPDEQLPDKVRDARRAYDAALEDTPHDEAKIEATWDALCAAVEWADEHKAWKRHE